MSGAVFLSYASQDAEAAKRICEALRAAGIEVWFDQSELRGGDAWDAKIRRQIKECALFVPVISENTNIRAEGYFRLEWKLAVDRSHLVADDTPFILPVVLGEISAPAARVPDKFREIQWTRMSLTVAPAELAERIARLLTGEPSAAVPSVRLSPTRQTSGTRTRRFLPIGVAGAVACLAAIFYFTRSKGDHAAPPGPAAGPAQAPEAQRLADRALAMCDAANASKSDLGVAEELARRATESDSLSADAWGVRALVQAKYIQRNWVFDDKVRQDADAFAKRALALNADEPQALLALGYLLFDRQAYGQAEIYLRHAYRLRPMDDRIARMLGRTVWYSGRHDEGISITKEALRRDPRDALAHYDLALLYIQSLQDSPGAGTKTYLVAAQQELDTCYDLQRIDSALIMKARLEGAWLGDTGTMRSLLDRVTPEGRDEDRCVYTFMLCGLLERQPDRVLAAARLTVHDYIEDMIVAEPMAWSAAFAYRLAGKENLARLQWQTAESVLRKRVQDHPGDDRYRVQLATTLAWLDRRDEAAREIAPIESAWREQISARHALELARYYAALGDPAKAVPLLRGQIESAFGATYWMLKLHPWWDKLRGNPEFEALLTEAPVFEAKK